MSSALQQKIHELDNLLKTYRCSNDMEYLNRFFRQVEQMQQDIKVLKQAEGIE